MAETDRKPTTGEWVAELEAVASAAESRAARYMQQRDQLLAAIDAHRSAFGPNAGHDPADGTLYHLADQIRINEREQGDG